MELKFTELRTTKKGKVGENIVQDYFVSLDYSVATWTTDCSHPIDFIVYREDKGMIGVEVKCYPARIYYDDRGIDFDDYRTYLNLSRKTKIPVWLFFVDDREQAIYYARIDDLRGKGKRYKTKINFPSGCFKRLRGLTEAEVLSITEVQ